MTTSPAVGDTAPDFTLPRDGGETVSLKDFRGKALVLYFYPKDDTSGCTTQAIGFSEKIKGFSDAGAQIVGLSKDSAQKHDKFKAKHDLKVILAADEELETIQTYGVWVEKNMYGRKYMGIERATFLIDAKGKINKVWRKVRVKGHVDAVLEAVLGLNA
ncbi:MAG: thioredoxin-dependent thiol peroxidase [Robiginitomaculum sp.]|nr:MAG: thioredoxin-dependent thiol peroxidase [Robiginitomaculum sp.]